MSGEQGGGGGGANLRPVRRTAGAVPMPLATPPCLLHRLRRFGIFWTVGQICSATSRLLVHESIAPAFYTQLKKRAESIKVRALWWGAFGPLDSLRAPLPCCPPLHLALALTPCPPNTPIDRQPSGARLPAGPRGV